MATIQATNWLVKIQPVLGADVYHVGPTESVPANDVQLTRENLRQIGAYPCRESTDWICTLWVYQTIAGVETLVDLAAIAVTASYWDPVSRTAVTLPADKTLIVGQLDITFLAAGTHVAGMYDFTITGTQTNVFDLCSGRIEILPARPVP